VGNAALPEHRAAEGIAGNQAPARRNEDRGGRCFVEDVEQPAARGDKSIEARHAVVMAGISRRADPAQSARRGHLGVVGHGVVRCIDLRGARLDYLLPRVALFDARHAARAEHAHDLGRRQCLATLDDQQIDDAIHVRQLPAVEAVNGRRAVTTLGHQQATRSSHRGGIDPGSTARPWTRQPGRWASATSSRPSPQPTCTISPPRTPAVCRSCSASWPAGCSALSCAARRWLP